MQAGARAGALAHPSRHPRRGTGASLHRRPRRGTGASLPGCSCWGAGTSLPSSPPRGTGSSSHGYSHQGTSPSSLSILLGHWGIPASTCGGALAVCPPGLLASVQGIPPRPSLPGGSAVALGQLCPQHAFQSTPASTHIRAPRVSQPGLLHGHRVGHWGHHGTGSVRVCRTLLSGLLAGRLEHLAAWTLLPGIAACMSPCPGDIGMEPYSHIQRGALLVQGPFALKMVLDLCWCLPHQKGCFCIEILRVSGESVGFFLFSRAILFLEVVWFGWVFLYNGTYVIQYTHPREPPPACLL